MEKAMAYLAVGLGSALGGMGRFWLAGLIGQRYGEAFPWGTILVNVSGCLVIGLLAAFTPATDGHPRLSPLAAQFLLVGICGGYTTFSAFSLQTLRLVQAGQWLAAGLNVALSLFACLAAVWLGYVIGQMLHR